MKYSARICMDAVAFALSRNQVRMALGPIDSNPNFTIKQIITRLVDSQSISTKIEIIFDYIDLQGNDTTPNIHVFLTWYKGTVAFTFDSVSISNP
ncbi:MAG: hypothetical protein ABI851_15940 [Saprospiraceae bacterium]